MQEKLLSVFEKAIHKYQGREWLLKKKIPVLDCLWNDVLHLAPINTQIILDVWRLEGLYEFASPKPSFDVYKIPVKLLNEAATICFQSFNFDINNYKPELDKYWRLEKTGYLLLVNTIRYNAEV